MSRIFDIKPKYVKYIPEQLEEGILYVSKDFGVAIHLCACGCKEETVTPLGSKGWTLTENKNNITLRPSIGNFAGEKPYHAHYFITNSKIDWL